MLRRFCPTATHSSAAQTGIPILTQELFCNGIKTANTATLASLGLQGDCSLLLRKIKARAQQARPPGSTVPAPAPGVHSPARAVPAAPRQEPDAATMMEVIRSDPATMDELSRSELGGESGCNGANSIGGVAQTTRH